MARGTNNHANGNQLMFGSRKSVKITAADLEIKELESLAESLVLKYDAKGHKRLLQAKHPSVYKVNQMFVRAELLKLDLNPTPEFQKEFYAKAEKLLGSEADLHDFPISKAWPGSKEGVLLAEKLFNKRNIQGVHQGPELMSVALQGIKNAQQMDSQAIATASTMKVYFEAMLQTIFNDNKHAELGWDRVGPNQKTFDYKTIKQQIERSEFGLRLGFRSWFTGTVPFGIIDVNDMLDGREELERVKWVLYAANRRDFVESLAKEMIRSGNAGIFAAMKESSRDKIKTSKLPFSKRNDREGFPVFSQKVLERAVSEFIDDPQTELEALIVKHQNR